MKSLLRPILLLLFLYPLSAPAAKTTFYAVGAAQVDITPDYPIRLSGYGARLKESEGIDQHLFAQALAIGSDKRSLAVLVTVDNVAVPACVAGRGRRPAGEEGRPAQRALCPVFHPHAHGADAESGLPQYLRRGPSARPAGAD